MSTIKQQRAVQKVVENGGNVSQGMISAGYSAKTAKTPKKLTDSKGWEELMEQYLPDTLIGEKHKELLEATGIGHMVFPLDASDTQIIELLREANCTAKRFMHSDSQTHVWYFAADNNARQKAIDMAYKLKGKYAPEKSEVNINAVEELSKDIKEMINAHTRRPKSNMP